MLWRRPPVSVCSNGPQGWATHLQQAMVPIQSYIQLRPLFLILILVFVLDLSHAVATQFPSIPPFSSTPFPPIPTPHAFVDLLPRLVALKAVDPTFWTTIMITGSVALCVPPFDKLGLPLHFVVCPPASIDFLGSAVKRKTRNYTRLPSARKAEMSRVRGAARPSTLFFCSELLG